MTGQVADNANDERACGQQRGAAGLLVHESRQKLPAKRPRIALLTPYSGRNLGDAAIQDAIIGNLRLRLPNSQYSGLTINGDNFMERHGTDAFPLYASRLPLYRSNVRSVKDHRHDGSSVRPASSSSLTSSLVRLLGRAPLLGSCLKAVHSLAERFCGELLHCIRGYRFLRTHDLLIVSGGGQLDEEWGGPWGHPFALFKWAVLAQIARVPYAVASVGACKINSKACRLLLSGALRMAQYRSYRDANSRQVAAGLLRRAARDPIVPDLAFSLPSSELPPPAGIRSISRGREVVAISPIAYAKPGIWASEDAALYERYLQHMVRLLSQLLERGYFLLMVCSCLGDDDRVVTEILERMDDESMRRAAGQMHVSRIRTWRDLIASLRDADFLVASRLHSAILGFITHTPTVAISFDPKVDWVMEDFGQTDYLLQSRDFSFEDMMVAFEYMKRRKEVVVMQIASYLQLIASGFKQQYETLAALALAGECCRL